MIFDKKGIKVKVNSHTDVDVEMPDWVLVFILVFFFGGFGWLVFSFYKLFN